MKIPKLFVSLMIVLSLILAACAPQVKVTVNGGTPKPAGNQQVVADEMSSPPKGDPTCVGPEATDQGELYLCYPKVTREEALAVPGLSQAISLELVDQLGRILIYSLLNGELALNPPAVDSQPIGWLVPYPKGFERVRAVEDQWAQARLLATGYTVPDVKAISGLSPAEAEAYREISQSPYWVLDNMFREFRMHIALGDPSGQVWVVFQAGIWDDSKGSTHAGAGKFVGVFYGSMDMVRVRFCLNHVVLPANYTPRMDFQYDPVNSGGRGQCEQLKDGEENKIPPPQ